MPELESLPPKLTPSTVATILGGLCLTALFAWLLARITPIPVRDGTPAITFFLRVFVTAMFGAIALAGTWPLARYVSARRLAGRVRELLARCPACGDAASQTAEGCGRCGHPAKGRAEAWKVDGPERLLAVVMAGVSTAIAALGGFMFAGAFASVGLGARVPAVLLALLLTAVGLPMMVGSAMYLAEQWRLPTRLRYTRSWQTEGVTQQASAVYHLEPGGMRAEGNLWTSEGPRTEVRVALDEGGLDDVSRGLARTLAAWMARDEAAVWRDRTITWRWSSARREAPAAQGAAYRTPASVTPDDVAREAVFEWNVTVTERGLDELLAADGLPAFTTEFDGEALFDGTSVALLRDALAGDPKVRAALEARADAQAPEAELAWCARALREAPATREG